ncbi:hypothetical protein QQY79_13595 [Flavobacterium tructae]|uniref:hypothetical protein n=1 Tax=Flavobacterium tructae TaxID=1114873 RepID=UPI0025520DE3|nr:hypothetical protein [Flavobacterium tructae]MDL2143559.1 hypothetical protein [Flavobacterium tructae]
MIKKSTYIRSFTALQQKQLEKVGKEQNFKTTPEILFFALDSYLEQQKEMERLNRIIKLKQEKIELLDSKIVFFKSASKKINELNEFLKKAK